MLLSFMVHKKLAMNETNIRMFQVNENRQGSLKISR